MEVVESQLKIVYRNSLEFMNLMPWMQLSFSSLTSVLENSKILLWVSTDTSVKFTGCIQDDLLHGFQEKS